MTDKMQQSFADGKYTVIYEGGKVTALRYGEPWQDLTGNNLVYWMLVEVDKLRGNPPAPTAQPDCLWARNGNAACPGAQPVQQPGAEPIGWQYRWTNPGSDPIVHQQDIDWKPVASRAPAQTIQQRIDELRGYKYTDGKPCYEVRAIYTQAAPAQRQPLTQDEILDMAEGVSLQFHDLLEFARAIEAAHGITAAPAAQREEKP